ncbi:13097_t:CDS:2, partial [Ambispora leptoticha]
DKLFEINGIKYRIIDTPGLGDTKLSKIETLQEIAKVYDKVKDGLSQVLFLSSGRFTPEEVETYNTLKEILFDENITKYTTIVRTKFDSFEDEEKCKEDIQSLLAENNKAITEMIESCDKRIIHTDNPPINISGGGKRTEMKIILNKETRELSREKSLNHLAKCNQIYKPESIEVLNKIELKERYKAFGLCQEYGVILKSLNDSQDITADFLREVAYYKLFKDDYDGVVKCFGISQDPATKDYIMVMDYIKNGDLRKYLTKYYHKLDFHNKLGQLCHLAKGLNNIHRQGLCRPVNETNQEEKIYGVLPYVAPEGKKATEFYQQYLETEELNKTLTSIPNSIPYQIDSQTYTSRLLDTDNLPPPQNSREINEKFYELYSPSLPYDFANLDLEESIEDWKYVRYEDAEWVLNYGNEKELREEHKKFMDSQLSSEVIKQIKKVENTTYFTEQDKKIATLSGEQKEQVEEQEKKCNEIIPEELKERYKEYGLCKNCNKLLEYGHNKQYKQCQPCNFRQFYYRDTFMQFLVRENLRSNDLCRSGSITSGNKQISGN